MNIEHSTSNIQHRILSLLALLGLSGLLLVAGCQSGRLETGGAYSPVITNADGTITATAAPDLALFQLDASYDLAYSGALTACRIERDNRVLLRTIAPDLKPQMDQVRREVWRVDQQWAAARQAYLAVPVPDNLTAISRALAEMQRWNAAATALLPTQTQGP